MLLDATCYRPSHLFISSSTQHGDVTDSVALSALPQVGSPQPMSSFHLATSMTFPEETFKKPKVLEMQTFT